MEKAAVLPPTTARLGLLVLLLAPAAAADEFAIPKEDTDWKLTISGYVHASYRWIQQPANYNLAGRNNGFELSQARLGANIQYKETLAARVSFEGASEDRINQAFPGGQLTARLRDAYLTWAPLRALRVTVGQIVTPWDLDSMRTDAELPFVSRSVAVEGVQSSEGRAIRGMGIDRNIGVSLHSGLIGIGRRNSFRYALFLGNGNGENRLLNDNNQPAFFGRLEYAFWGDAGLPADRIGPMRLVTDGSHRPIINLGLAAQYNPRTAGNPPDLISETDAGVAADLAVTFYGVELQGGLIYVRTSHDTLSSIPDIERFGWWAHLRARIPKLPLDIIPGYRIGNYAPRAHLQTKAIDTQYDANLTLLYHTIGVTVRPRPKFPLHMSVNYTITGERGANVLNNDRFEVDAVMVF